MVTPTISSYETYTAIFAPTYNAGRLWYDSTQNALAYYNDVTNNTLHIGEEIQLKVYNNTGSTINIGQPVYVTSTSSGYTYPNVALAIANSLTTGNVIGLANQAIPTGTAGYVTTIGLIQGVNTGSYTVGDTLYLSPYSAGFYQNTIPPTGYAIKLGTVAYVNSTTGAIYVNKSILTIQAGNIVGQVALANGGTNANLTASAGAVVYSTASALALSAVGSTGQVLTSQGTSAPIWSNNAATVSVTDDTSSNTTEYITFARQTTSTINTLYTASTQVKFNPSTGIFIAPTFSGSLAASNLTGTTLPSSIVTSSLTTVGTIATGFWNGTTIATGYGGTGLTTYTTGDILYASATNTLSKLAVGTTGYTLTVASGAPIWKPPYVRTSFTATASQTTFSATYNVGYVQVFMNGVLLNGADYTATNGTSVVLSVAANAGDIVETIAYNV